jgi:hypothetical protein
VLGVFGQVYGGHAAAPDLALDSIAPGEACAEAVE